MVESRPQGDDPANDFFTMKVDSDWKKDFKAFAKAQGEDMTTIAKRGIALAMSGSSAPSPNEVRLELVPETQKNLAEVAERFGHVEIEPFISLLISRALKKSPTEMRDFLFGDLDGEETAAEKVVRKMPAALVDNIAARLEARQAEKAKTTKRKTA